MSDNEEGRRDRNNRRASILDTPTCEGRVGVLARTNTNTLGFLARKGRRPRKDGYKHNRLPRKEGSGVATQKTRAPRKGRQTGIKHTNGFLARKGLGVTMRQTQKHGLLTRSGKRALSAVGITAARDTQLIGRTGAHNLLKYWGPERFGNDRTSERRVGGMSSLCSTREQGGKKGQNPLSFRALQTKTCPITKKGAATGTTVGPLFLTALVLTDGSGDASSIGAESRSNDARIVRRSSAVSSPSLSGEQSEFGVAEDSKGTDRVAGAVAELSTENAMNGDIEERQALISGTEFKSTPPMRRLGVEAMSKSRGECSMRTGVSYESVQGIRAVNGGDIFWTSEKSTLGMDESEVEVGLETALKLELGV
ncbi:hypothetical protein F5890DRAFT_1587883 [Lentinula detonsa]|uniref:Uncharacterized protein n=1 Tax=Lentinula detonsa TaxID=2804962 RepID=A0AA38URX4_9AGAR|nr:hypothetical protein F5890DRAFT_1587883 [Lentinula detonsa]